ncbi:MAG: radical SAM protein [Elusimicrobia bacterium]|nr:radical SAM protein [Elusimicrobiota bacterium]
MDSHNIKVGLVQINNSFSDQNYFPYSIGTLQAYAQKKLRHPQDYEFLLPIYKRSSINEALGKLSGAELIFFSCYVWNFRISLEIARAVKQKEPETVIIFGGPHVPDHQDALEAFMREHPFIDLACHGEGEQVFASILENYPLRNWDAVASISFLRKDDSLAQTARAERLKDISIIPSPYTEKFFKQLMEANPQEKWIALWETNRGCPFSCTFCDWGSATQSKVYQFSMERLTQEVDWFAKHKIEFIFCADANFGILPRDVDLVNYVASTKKKYGYPQALSVQNTKNATERAYKVQKILADAGLNKGVVISLQSVNPQTLKDIKRDNISSDSFRELQRRFTRDGVQTMSDMILGLPGETYGSFADGVSSVIQSGQHNRIQFNNLSILPNAEMGNPDYQKQYGLVMVESKVVNIHGALAQSQDEIYETQILVVGSNAMPKQDWVRTRAFCWMVALLHFDKIAQIPIILLHQICSISYRELFEIFSEGNLEAYPTLLEVRAFFQEQAREIQNGGVEYCYSKDWLGIHWPADEFVFIKLCREDKLDIFYRELETVINKYLEAKPIKLPLLLLHEAIELNKSLIKKPFQKTNLNLELSCNIWEFYQSILSGAPVLLQNKPSRYHIDRVANTWDSWEQWCQQVVWYGNKRGAYLYANKPLEYPDLAGHY